MTTGINSPVGTGYAQGATVTPHDTNELAVYAKALYVSVAGALKITTPAGSVITIPTCAVGVCPLPAKLVWSTGTAATGIVALY